jgi:hypothetical protein
MRKVIEMRTLQRLLPRIPAAFAALLAAGLPASEMAAQPAPDSVTVATVTAAGGLVDVPVYIRDLSGTPLGIDQPSGSRIQSYSIKVTCTPPAAVQSVTLARAGITAPLTPAAEFTPSGPATASLVDTFQESTNLIPFTLDAAAPGNQVAHLTVLLSPSVTPGSTVTLTLDPVLTTLSNQTGTASETVALQTLALVNGAINIPSSFVFDIPALSTWALALLALALAAVAMKVM